MVHNTILGILLALTSAATCRALTPEQIYCLVASSDGHYVAANLGGTSGVDVFDLKTGKRIAELESASSEGVKAREAALPEIQSKSWVHQLAFSTDQKQLVCATYDKEASLMVWDTTRFDNPLYIKTALGLSCDELAFPSDSKVLLAFMRGSPNSNDVLIAWDIVTGTENWRRDLGISKVQHAHFSAKGDTVILENRDGTRTAQESKSGKAVLDAQVNPSEADDSASKYQITRKDKEITVTNVKTKAAMVLKAKGEIKAHLLTSNELVVAESGLGLQVWNAESGDLLFNLGNPEAVPSKSPFQN